MSRFEALKDPLARAIDRAVQALGDQLDGQLEDGRRKLHEAGEALKSELPAALLEDEAIALLAQPQPSDGGKLLESAARIDRASSQGEVLVALLEETRVYGSRSAFFLAKEDGVEGWSSEGFRFDAEALSGRLFGFGREPWAQLRSANGVVRIEGEATGLLAKDLGAEAGAAGVFVPFVLRNQLAGFLYVEGDESAIDTAALRLLVHLAALSIETLPTRGEGTSPALLDSEAAESALPVYVAGSVATAAAVVQATDGTQESSAERTAVAKDEAAAETGGVEVVELEAIEPELAQRSSTSSSGDLGTGSGVVAEIAADPVPLTVAPQDFEEDTEEDTMELEEVIAPLPRDVELTAPLETLDEIVVETPVERLSPAGDETFPAATDLGLPATSGGNAPGVERATAGVPFVDGVGNDTQAAVAPITVRPEHGSDVEELFGEETVTEQIQVDASFPRIRSDAEVDREEEGERENDTLELEPIDPSLIQHDDPAFPGQTPVATSRPEASKQAVAFELDDSRFATPSPQRTVRLDLDQLESQAAAPPPAARIDAAIAPEPGPAPESGSVDSAHSEDATLMAERSAVYRPPVEPAAPPAAPARKSTEVAPPSDLSGPGSAFTAGGSDGDQALREEARRLARLLVSEIKLYNEDQLEEGRREGNIYNRLRDDLDRSRKMYHERIDPRLTDADDYFHQELVDRLAGGNADLLGM